MQNHILIQKFEALAFLIIALVVYYLMGASWWLFIALLLLPDIFMLGYIKNTKVGALVYNIGHTYIAPFLLLVIFYIFSIPLLLPISIIWIAHISLDRVFGYGLKLDTNFKDTHLGHIGK